MSHQFFKADLKNADIKTQNKMTKLKKVGESNNFNQSYNNRIISNKKDIKTKHRLYVTR